MTRRWFKPLVAAAAACVIGAVLVVWNLPGPGGASIAWADVRQHARSASSVVFTATDMTRADGGGKMVKTMYKSKNPHLLRIETSRPAPAEDLMITLIDLNAGKVLVLVPGKKQAIWHAEQKDASVPRVDFLDRMLYLISGADKRLGKREIDGQTLEGVQITSPTETVEFWVSPQTGYPVLVNGKKTGGPAESSEFSGRFVFDEELSDSLFALQVPEGYQVVTSVKGTPPGN